jgi:UDP-N-acetylmuramoyl-L-alanyl-D-glutamate--2,6-diaminopimelate ligase
VKLNELTSLAQDLPPLEILGITADSRSVKPGYLFAALEGTTVDGRRFIPDAIAAGAVAVLALPGTECDVPVIESEMPRLTLAQLAMRFFPGQPSHIAGITGTNGKTSVARFTQQLWLAGGHRAGTLGTLGAFAPGYEYALRHTTPDPVEIHQILSTMATMGTTHLAMEVSSHGLSQYRADGIHFRTAAFTNITQDHLDYHADFEDYFQAKMRLLTELLPRGNTAVLNLDGPGSDRAAEVARKAGRETFTVGRAGEDIRLLRVEPTATGLDVALSHGGRDHEVSLNMIGAFQADNALVAAGLAIVGGMPAEQAIAQLSSLTAAPGRMQPAGERRFSDKASATAYVDFAHTPDALTTALAAIRPHTDGNIVIVLGAGGDRDRAKRPLMGKAAAQGATVVVVTDDNPRSEDPAAIRADVKKGAPDAIEIAGREEAIRHAAGKLRPGDVLLVAGKGHETGQTIAGVTYPFSDVEVTRKAMQELSE